MIIDIQRHLNQFNLDIRKSGEARFIDQKCTPDVVCFISDCLMNLEPQGEFTVQDVWNMRYFVKNASAIFGKPSPKEKTAHSEYDKFIQQPLRMLAYAHILNIEKRGNVNYYSVNSWDLLEFIATKERNAYSFLYLYIVKVLSDSNFLRVFEEYKQKAKTGNADKKDFAYVKERYDNFIIGNTPINTPVEVHRIFTKVFNIYCCEHNIQGTIKGHQSKYSITFSDLMYNRVNWRDVDKAKALTRTQAATPEETKRQEEYDAYQVAKAINLLKKIQIESEVKDQYANGEATQVHHIFPKSEFPQIAHYLENLIKLTPTQHYTKAHPSNKTQIVNKDYQLVCLISKSNTIENSLKQVGEKYYRKESFIVVINTGLDVELSFNLTFQQIRTKLRLIYNS